MAPEQWVGVANVSTDIYGLGVVLYELFCGRRPFELPEGGRDAHRDLKNLEWKRLHTEAPVPDPRQWREEFPEALAALLNECLAKVPTDRPPSGTAVRERLEAIHICTEGYDPANGARPLARTIERLIGRPLSELLVSGAMRAGDNVRVDVEGGKIEFRQLQLEGFGEETL
jgi:serine/threonine protein kinase